MDKSSKFIELSWIDADGAKGEIYDANFCLNGFPSLQFCLSFIVFLVLHAIWYDALVKELKGE